MRAGRGEGKESLFAKRAEKSAERKAIWVSRVGGGCAKKQRVVSTNKKERAFSPGWKGGKNSPGGRKGVVGTKTGKGTTVLKGGKLSTTESEEPEKEAGRNFVGEALEPRTHEDWGSDLFLKPQTFPPPQGTKFLVRERSGKFYGEKGDSLVGQKKESK